MRGPIAQNRSTDSGRTWPTTRPWVMRMSWHDLLFAHWPLRASVLRPLIPPALAIDTFDGWSWIGVVPFRMTDVAPRCVPAMPGLSSFPELNVRTYVTADNKPGVWFFSLDATNRLAVRLARQLFHLPYMDARITMDHQGDSVHYQSSRTHRGELPATLDVSYQAWGDPFAAAAGSLEHFLTARYCLYTADRQGRVLRGEVDHPPWQLRQARGEFRESSMIQGAGLPQPRGAAHLLYAHRTDVRATLNQRIDSFLDDSAAAEL